MPKSSSQVLELRNVSKSYGQTHALSSVSMTVHRGSIHGLVGSNGAGKSTVMKIISGVTVPSAGVLRYRGEPVAWRSPIDAGRNGIGTAHQHIELAADLSALENVFLGEGGWQRRDPELYARYAALQRRLGVEIGPDEAVRGLSVAQRQLLTIMRALSSEREPELVILDEPTAPLSAVERSSLFATMRQLADSGIAVIFCSHFLDEVLGVTDQVTVLRDGRVVASVATADVDEDRLVELIVGQRLLQVEHEGAASVDPDAPVVLAVEAVRLYEDAEPFSFEVRAGEIVGIAGLIGSGRSRLLHTLFGARRPVSGSLAYLGGKYPMSPPAAVARGIGLVPEDRIRQALMRDWEIWRNVSLAGLGGLARRGLTRRRRERGVAEASVQRLSIKTGSVDTLVSRLSGGNAQKVVIAKWLAIRPRLLLLDDPVVGVDVAAKADILLAIRELAADGCAVVVVSSEFEELLAVASRILVQRRGAIVGERPARGLEKSDLVAMASGVRRLDESLVA